MSDSMVVEVMPKVGVINTGAGNLYSLNGCLRRIGFEPVTINSPADMQGKDISALIIPGQGRFGTVMSNLRNSGLDKLISDWYQGDKKVVGICVGLQVLFEESEEDPGIKGLGIFKGKVTRLKSPKQPMVGWADVDSEKNWLDQTTLYFVNSYGVTESEQAIASVTYGETFVAAIASNQLVAFQCHPEKSGIAGEEVLKQCLS
ncbi:imidazole glycerol phosphate synthase subunit HisH [Kangiella aquimarina]|uniref:Imidazole glycerol phosphate synthase subunit HisH n=1 Tax=Kangiella aquimarina TaxID=261965 RepID=A0ABZ0X2P6_9GAMM|nr:imidazole glycerol phosphate synthase subunit HisH [Kangiella aquimarina]WQG84863.1 imidazole glycerol phosphate synthase subunit HisH [Kangiella aquimarina]